MGTRWVLLYVANVVCGARLLPHYLMAKAKETSSADKKFKIVKRINLNDLTLSVGEDQNYSVQRTYVYNGKVGYSNWLRQKDLGDVRELLQSYQQWFESNYVDVLSDQAA